MLDKAWKLCWKINGFELWRTKWQLQNWAKLIQLKVDFAWGKWPVAISLRKLKETKTKRAVFWSLWWTLYSGHFFAWPKTSKRNEKIFLITKSLPARGCKSFITAIQWYAGASAIFVIFVTICKDQKFILNWSLKCFEDFCAIAKGERFGFADLHKSSNVFGPTAMKNLELLKTVCYFYSNFNFWP